jgi:Lon protease-like protein
VNKIENIIIPLFPLNGAIFFPNSNLPLNIFEKKYIEMVDFALSSNRLIGMIQTNSNGGFYSIGSFGKINSFSETNDKRYIINLYGLNYFKIEKELNREENFIIANVKIVNNYNQNLKKDSINFDREILIEKYTKHLQNQKLKIDVDIIKGIEDEELIKFIAMSCSFLTEDKQMLLETYSVNELGNKLISLFDFYPPNIGNKKSIN